MASRVFYDKENATKFAKAKRNDGKKAKVNAEKMVKQTSPGNWEFYRMRYTVVYTD